MINRFGENIKNVIEYEVSKKLVLKYMSIGKKICIFGGNYSGEMRYLIYKKTGAELHNHIDEQTFNKIIFKLPLNINNFGENEILTYNK